MKKYDTISKILFFGCVIVPFTALRFGAIGIGEVLIVLAFLASIVSKGAKISVSKRHLFTRFWVGYLIVISIAFLFNFAFKAESSGTLEQAGFDFAAYVLVLVFCVTASNLHRLRGRGEEDFYYKVYIVWYLIYASLHVGSLFSSSLFQLPLRTYGNFTPLVPNIHQASMLFCALPFFGAYMYTIPTRPVERVGVLLTIVHFAVMALDSGSTKAMMALCAGGISFVFWVLSYRRSGRDRLFLNFLVLGVSFVVMFVGAVVFFESISAVAIDFFHDADNHSARETIYAAALKHGLDSMLLGYGPGPQVLFGGEYKDAHLTFLTAFLQGGFVGVILLSIVAIRILRIVCFSPALLSCYVAISVYVLGGDILRRLPIWILLVGLVALGRSESQVPRLRESAALRFRPKKPKPGRGASVV